MKTNVVIAVSVIIFSILLFLEREFRVYIGQSASIREELFAFPAARYYRHERIWWRICCGLTFLFAAGVIYMSIMGCLSPLCGLVAVPPLSVCVYRILFRYNFHPLSDWLVTIAVVLLYASVLTLADNTAGLFGTGLGEDMLAKMIGSVSPLIGGGVVLSIVLKLMEEAGKSWLSNSARMNANADSGTQKRFSQVRQIILSNRRHGFLAILGFVVILSATEIVCSVIYSQSDQVTASSHATTILPFLADVGLLSVFLCVIGFVLSAYMSEEALLKAERAYLGYTAAKLAWRFEKKNRPLYDRVKYSWLKHLLYRPNAKKIQQTAYLWDDFRQVFFHFCYSAKDIISNKEYESCAARIMADVLELRRKKWQNYISAEREELGIEERATHEERMCPTWDATDLFELHRTTYENFFVQINEHGILARSQTQHAEISSMLCDTLRKNMDPESTQGQSAVPASIEPDIEMPFQLFMFLHNVFLKSVKWETKSALFQQRNTSPLHIYEIAFARFVNECLQWRYDTEHCPLAWICRKNNCRFANHTDSRLSLCQILMFFPYSISETMKHFANRNDENVFEQQEYEQYFTLLSRKNCFLIFDGGFTKENMRTLNRDIHVLERNQILCVAIGKSSEAIPARTVPPDRVFNVADVYTMYDLVDKREEVISMGVEAGFESDNNVEACWRLLYKLVVNNR